MAVAKGISPHSWFCRTRRLTASPSEKASAALATHMSRWRSSPAKELHTRSVIAWAGCQRGALPCSRGWPPGTNAPRGYRDAAGIVGVAHAACKRQELTRKLRPVVQVVLLEQQRHQVHVLRAQQTEQHRDEPVPLSPPTYFPRPLSWMPSSHDRCQGPT